MANLIQNGGFEVAGIDDEHAESWIHIQHPFSLRYGPAARTGFFGAAISAFPGFPGNPGGNGRVLQTVGSTPGAFYDMSVWAKRVSGNSGFEIVDNVGMPYAMLTSAQATGEWQNVLATIISGSDQIHFELRNMDHTVSSTWYVDDASIVPTSLGAVMPKPLSQSYIAVINAVKGINGLAGGFHHDLGGRVLSRLLWPSDAGAPKTPYVCVVLEWGSGGFPEVHEDFTRIVLPLSIVGYVPMDELASIATSSEIRALNLLEDMMKAILPAQPPYWWTLPGAIRIQNISFRNHEITPAEEDGIQFIEIQLGVDVEVRFTRSDLGP